jgi:hypothetical protein
MLDAAKQAKQVCAVSANEATRVPIVWKARRFERATSYAMRSAKAERSSACVASQRQRGSVGCERVRLGWDKHCLVRNPCRNVR